MRTRIISMAILLLCTATLILAQRPTGEDLFQRGLDQERGKRDIPAAIKIYEDILKQFPSNRVLMAKTLAQLGDCYEKLGQSKAQEYYQQVITRYPDQLDMVAKAKAQLANLMGVPSTPAPSTRFEFALPQGLHLAHGFRTGADISPDGKRIAFVALDNNSLGVLGPVERRMIYLKSTDDFGQTVPIPGTEAGYNPFFSPDGQWLGFFSGWFVSPGAPPQEARVQIKKVALTGGPPIVLANLPVAPRQPDNFGATWGSDGAIVFGSFKDGLQWIPETGGVPQLLTHLDAGAGEVSHRLPHFLPDGSGLLFTVLRTGSPDFLSNPQIWVLPKTGKPKLVMEDGTDARFANNRLIFARDGKLFAVAFDAKTLSASGAPVPITDDGVVHATRNVTTGTRTGAAQFSVSRDGSLLYAPGSIEPDQNRSVVWVDERGAVTPIGIQPRQYFWARLSPNGRYISLTTGDGIWLYDTVVERLESQPGIANVLGPASWSPDGTQLAYGVGENSVATFLKEVTSSSIQKVLADYYHPMWTNPDGRELVLQRQSDNRGIYVVSLEQPGQVQPLLQDSKHSYAFPAFSPDGRWLAYCSNESGRWEVFVQPYPGPGPRVKVSADSIIAPNGQSVSPPANTNFTGPAWSRDGQRLFFSIQSGGIVSVKFQISAGQFIPATPTVLFRANFISTIGSRSWDVAPDGRFVMIQPDSVENQLERDRKIFPSMLVLMVPSTQRITLGSVSTTAVPSIPRLSGPTRETTLLWFDRSPVVPPEPAVPAGEYFMPELSPDGKWVAFTRGNPPNLWRMELATGQPQRVTNNNNALANPRWSPDGTMIAVEGQGAGRGITILTPGRDVVRPSPILPYTGVQKTLSDWSPDGRYIVYVSNGDLFALPLSVDATAAGEPKQITMTPFAESDARVSPDGRWIAYVSKERGRNEIYIESFPERGVKLPVSKEGGIQPRWTDGGATLIYFEPATPGARYLAVSIQTAAGQAAIGAVHPFGPAPNPGYSGMMEREYTFNVFADRLLMQAGGNLFR